MGLSANSSSTCSLVLASTFYTPALERPFSEALGRALEAYSVSCVPYNQLHTFLLDPRSVIPEGTPAAIVLLLRVEDLVRLELVALGHITTGAADRCIRAFRERTEEFLDVLRRMSRVSLTTMICPSGRGAYDLKFLGNAVRVSEHKIAAELRRQQRNLVISWSEFERAAKPENWLNSAGDRLGHVPFSPEGLEALARFCVGQLDRMPTTILSPQADGHGTADLERFLSSLELEMKVTPLIEEDEQQAINLVRHTTHFINVLDRKWELGGIRALAASAPRGEAWTVSVRDRFGDYGVSGALTIGIENCLVRVGLLFLTCPVLGRQVEYAFLGWMAKLAEQRGADYIEVPFTAGRDNQALQSLLAILAGEPSGSNTASVSSGGARSFRLRVEGLADQVVREAPNSASVKAILSKLQVEQVHFLA